MKTHEHWRNAGGEEFVARKEAAVGTFSGNTLLISGCVCVIGEARLGIYDMASLPGNPTLESIKELER